MKKRIIFVIVLLIAIVSLCGCDTGHKTTITHVTTEINARPTHIEERREYETDSKGNIIRDTGWVSVE